MLDYYGSFIKNKKEIYDELLSLYPDYNKQYITLKIDYLYDIEYINKEVSVSGWLIFVRSAVRNLIDSEITKDTAKAKLHLFTQYLLKDKLINDIIYKISFV